ncbi:hypothetical protein QUB75_22725 [Microcoleus sp. K1-B6]
MQFKRNEKLDQKWAEAGGENMSQFIAFVKELETQIESYCFRLHEGHDTE